jgi:predicted nucleotidyltransferase
LSFPSAREKALLDYLHEEGFEYASIRELMGSSNNILGIEYLKALKRLDSGIVPYTVRRMGSGYNSECLTGNISSATAIRKALKDGSADSLTRLLETSVPKPTADVLLEEFSKGKGPVFPDAFDGILLARLRSMSLKELASLPYVSEGLENRIKKAADDSGTVEEIINAISTRRYAKTRIQRKPCFGARSMIQKRTQSNQPKGANFGKCTAGSRNAQR